MRGPEGRDGTMVATMQIRQLESDVNDPEEDELFGGEGHDEMNPFADDFDRYGIYGPDNVQCPPGKDTCNFAPGKSECCKTGEFCIPNVGCRCEEPPKDLKDDSHSDPVDISEMYIV